MKILVTNDDGIKSEGLWKLAGALTGVGQVTVAAPAYEQSAIGTAVTLSKSLKLQKEESPVSGVAAYSIEGTPSDSVILALLKLVENVDIIVSGINNGSNLGEDIIISGTVGGALQGFLRGFPALAVSSPRDNSSVLDTAAGIAAVLARRMVNLPGQAKIFLNINLPDLPIEKLAGVKITRLARESHIETVTDDEQGRRGYYRLVRAMTAKSHDNSTDIRAIERGYVSVTPIYFSRFDKPARHVVEELCSDLLGQVGKDKKSA